MRAVSKMKFDDDYARESYIRQLKALGDADREKAAKRRAEAKISCPVAGCDGHGRIVSKVKRTAHYGKNQIGTEVVHVLATSRPCPNPAHSA